MNKIMDAEPQSLADLLSYILSDKSDDEEKPPRLWCTGVI